MNDIIGKEMRMALPIFWCVDDETRGKLASLLKELSALKKDECVDWETGKPFKAPKPKEDAEETTEAEALFKEMKRPPHHPVRIK